MSTQRQKDQRVGPSPVPGPINMLMPIKSLQLILKKKKKCSQC